MLDLNFLMMPAFTNAEMANMHFLCGLAFGNVKEAKRKPSVIDMTSYHILKHLQNQRILFDDLEMQERHNLKMRLTNIQK